MKGEMTSGTNTWGTSWIAMTRADASVEPVSSKTKNESANSPAIPPAAPRTVANVMSEKSRVQRLTLSGGVCSTPGESVGMGASS